MIIDTAITLHEQPTPSAFNAAAEAACLRAARDDLEQFAPIYERYFTRVYAYCLRRVDDPQEAEDLTSLIFTRAMTSLDQYRGGLVAAWLFRIAHNTVINHHKATRRTLPLDTAELMAGNANLLERIILSEEQQTLQAMVDQLPRDQRNLLLLKVIGGLPSHEIGKIVGKSAGSVRVALHRILHQLQIIYRQHEENSDDNTI